MPNRLSFLLADDDEDDRDLFESVLRDEAHDALIKSVTDGTDVIAYLNNCTEELLPNVLVLDYNMPLMTGAKVLEIICGNPKFDKIAKFMMSTAAQPEYIDRCKKKGAIKYFAKATNMTDLTEIAREIIAYGKRMSK